MSYRRNFQSRKGCHRPLLFVIYINNLPNVFNSCYASLYADDTVIYCYGTSSKEFSDKLNNDLLDATVAKWLHDHKLTLNLDKTKCMLIGSNRKRKSKVDLTVSLKRYIRSLREGCPHLSRYPCPWLCTMLASLLRLLTLAQHQDRCSSAANPRMFAFPFLWKFSSIPGSLKDWIHVRLSNVNTMPGNPAVLDNPTFQGYRTTSKETTISQHNIRRLLPTFRRYCLGPDSW